MLTRRQLRIKVMQAIFAFQKQENAEIKEFETFLNQSMTKTYSLFLYMTQLLVEIHKLAEDKVIKGQQRHLATDSDLNPTRNFIDNKILTKLRESQVLVDALKQRDLKPWHLNVRYVENLYNQITTSKTYVIYMSEPDQSLKADLKFLTQIYTDIIAPNDEILDFLEDENITWTDDYPLVNSAMIMFLRKIKPGKEIKLPELIKDEDDVKFTMDLFRKTLFNREEFLERIEGKTPNWEQDRIAQIDLVLIMMAQCEFLKFNSIPVKVSLNEYLEISKDYSTPKSSFFINGILDNLSKEYETEGVLNKSGRGLM
ncbi:MULTISPECIES: transcription antitermination protein NusB [Nonlabens]|uniref:NusB antitermination factor n=2 Tax=Nonlabens ulvanivorans TaxID=906888 RepID=A0A081DDM7_NONUL|nr:transcription antitermination protein NusB [Nonlabens ulvanivorans]PRX14508.1 NusB antitermination factor [Nonlabens ulvanivorans]GAK77023.1 transcription termination protein NusB [Nonlabens ulvanivorans]GAL74790.1 transcription termination protein NusB [Nonlabens ulvanivorans]